MNLLLDTNILIDFVLDRKPYSHAVRSLCIASKFGDLQLWVTTQSYMDAYYVLRRSASEDDVKQALVATLQFFLPCGINVAELKPTLESSWPDIEDYMIAFTAKRMKANYLITRDEDVAARSPIPAMDAETFLHRLEKDQGLSYAEIAL